MCVRACMHVCVVIYIKVYLYLYVFTPFLSGTQSCPATSFAESVARNREDAQNVSEQSQWLPEYACYPLTRTTPSPSSPSEPVYTNFRHNSNRLGYAKHGVEKQQLGRKLKENQHLLWQEEMRGKVQSRQRTKARSFRPPCLRRDSSPHLRGSRGCPSITEGDCDLRSWEWPPVIKWKLNNVCDRSCIKV